MKRTPTYRLAPRWRPLPGERTQGDGHTIAPFLERVTEEGQEALGRFGPQRRPRGPDGRFLPDPQPGLCLILLVIAIGEGTAPEYRAWTVKKLSDETATEGPEVREDLDFWIRHGLVVEA